MNARLFSALRELADAFYAHRPYSKRTTSMERLVAMGFATKTPGHWSWRITFAGRAALAKMEKPQ